MTEQQARVLAFIRSFWADHGFAPSYANISENVGIASRSGVHRVVHALRERGYLTLSPNRARAIRLTDLANTAPAIRIASAHNG